MARRSKLQGAYWLRLTAHELPASRVEANAKLAVTGRCCTDPASRMESRLAATGMLQCGKATANYHEAPASMAESAPSRRILQGINRGVDDSTELRLTFNHFLILHRGVA